MAKILVTGATGFIGKRLVSQLLEEGHEVVALVRVKGTEFKVKYPERLSLIYGDIRFPEKMEPLPTDIEVAYYLVHSLGSFATNLIETEVDIAKKFIALIEQTAVRQIIFLSGIIENEIGLSPHLLSRLSVEKELLSSRVSTTILRASIIIGSGSASFEIIRDLCEKLPLMIAPKWVRSYCQPIGVRDVIFYLTHVLLNEQTYHRTFDIGGPEAMTFKEVLKRYASFRQLKRYIIDVPVLTPRLSSYWLVLITPVRFSICRYLVDSMKQSTRKLNLEIDRILPHNCLTYEESLQLAFQRIAQNEVMSTWMDAWNDEKVQGDLQRYIEVPEEGCLKDVQKRKIEIPVEILQGKIWSIGGATGWYSMNWAWRLRGLFDQLIGGRGLNRGRRHPTDLQVGDTIDFWRVILADEQKKHLILYAEMKLPGEAWLDFQINPTENLFIQTATFRPRGVWGRLYWYLLYPIHRIIFRNMAHAIVKKMG
jgi:uncharacterized protein YbjT (DUF2867 family)